MQKEVSFLHLWWFRNVPVKKTFSMLALCPKLSWWCYLKAVKQSFVMPLALLGKYTHLPKGCVILQDHEIPIYFFDRNSTVIRTINELEAVDFVFHITVNVLFFRFTFCHAILHLLIMQPFVELNIKWICNLKNTWQNFKIPWMFGREISSCKIRWSSFFKY